MNPCICTLYTDNLLDFAPSIIKSFEQFAKVNEFDLITHNKLFDDSFYPSWNKLHIILDCFAKGYEWVLWADVDSVFVNQNKFMEQFDLEKVTLAVNADRNGICLSHILIRNTDYNKTLLKTLLFLGEVKDHRAFGVGGVKWEQNAFKALHRHFHIKADMFPTYVVNEYGYAPFDARNHFVHVWDRPQRAKLLMDVYNQFYPT